MTRWMRPHEWLRPEARTERLALERECEVEQPHAPGCRHSGGLPLGALSRPQGGLRCADDRPGGAPRRLRRVACSVPRQPLMMGDGPECGEQGLVCSAAPT